MPKVVKGYLTEQGKFFSEKDEATSFEAMSVAKQVTGDALAASTGYKNGSLEHQKLLRLLVLDADKLAPAFRAMARFAKRNRKERESSAQNAAEVATENSNVQNAITQLVAKHF